MHHAVRGHCVDVNAMCHQSSYSSAEVAAPFGIWVHHTQNTVQQSLNSGEITRWLRSQLKLRNSLHRQRCDNRNSRRGRQQNQQMPLTTGRPAATQQTAIKHATQCKSTMSCHVVNVGSKLALASSNSVTRVKSSCAKRNASCRQS